MTDSSHLLPVQSERLFLEDDREPGRRIGVRVDRWDDAHGQRPVAVLVHGFKGFMDWGFFPYLSLRLAASGFVVVSMNASGSGVGDDPLALDDEEAFERHTYTRELEDIARVRAFARALDGVDEQREVLFGHSRGGGMVVLSAAASPPAAVVTWAAIDDADRFDDDVKRKWREDGVLRIPNARTGQVHRIALTALDDLEQNRERLDILAAARQLDAPLLAIHGTKDTTVDPEAAHRIAENSRFGEAFIVDGADHALGAKHPLEAPEEIRTLQVAIDATLAFVLSKVLP